MKVILNATAMKKLIDDQPELEAEFAKNAAAQVATILYSEHTTKRIGAAVKAVIEDQTKLHRGHMLSTIVADMVRAEVTKIAADVMAARASQLISDAVSKALTDRMPSILMKIEATIDRDLQPKIDAAIQRRVMALVSLKVPA